MIIHFRRLKKTLLIFLLIFCFDFLASIIFLFVVFHFLNSSKNLETYDVGLVFNHSYLLDYQVFSGEGVERIKLAMKAYNDGLINNILCTGGYVKSINFSAALEMKKMLIDFGINDSAIYYDSISNNTLSSWHESRKIIQQKKWHSVLIISSPFHLYRISKIVNSKELTIGYKSFTFWDYCKIKGCLNLYFEIHLEWMKLIGLNFSDSAYEYFSSKWKKLKHIEK